MTRHNIQRETPNNLIAQSIFVSFLSCRRVGLAVPVRQNSRTYRVAKERAAQRVGQSRIARVRVSRVSRLSRRAATTAQSTGHIAAFAPPVRRQGVTSGC